MGRKSEGEFIGYGVPATPERIAELTRAGVSIPRKPQGQVGTERRGSVMDRMQDVDGSVTMAAHDFSTEEGQAYWNEVIPKAIAVIDESEEVLKIAPVAWYGMTINLVRLAVNIRRALEAHPEDEELKVTLNLINLDIEQYLVCAMMEAVRAVGKK